MAPFANAQTTLFSFDFEGDTPPALPAGWVEPAGDTNANVVENIFTTGNSSTRTLGFGGGTGGVYIATSTVDLTPYASNTTFTLSFDYYHNLGDHTSLLIAFNDTTSGYEDAVSGNGFKWVGADTFDGGLAGLMFHFDPTGPATWQHFEIDVTDAVNLYLTATNGPSTDFQVAFQNWVSGAGGGSQEIYLDNLTFTATAVPEPSTYAAILGLGALGFVAWRRRRKHA